MINKEEHIKLNKKIETLENQVKAFGVEMDRIEEAYRKFVEENLDHVFEITEYADKRIKKLEDLKDFIFHHNHEGKIEKVNGRCDSIREIFQNLSNKVNAQDKTIENLEDHKQNYEYLWERIKNLEAQEKKHKGFLEVDVARIIDLEKQLNELKTKGKWW